jgi:hypothetical protein
MCIYVQMYMHIYVYAEEACSEVAGGAAVAPAEAEESKNSTSFKKRKESILWFNNLAVQI